MEGGVELPFTVFPQPSALIQPPEGAFDDRAFGEDDERVELLARDDLDGGPRDWARRLAKGRPR